MGNDMMSLYMLTCTTIGSIIVGTVIGVVIAGSFMKAWDYLYKKN